MLQAHARIPTDKASRYLAQLCKHFAHKVDVDWSDDRGQADFGMGCCDLAVSGSELCLTCSSPTEDGLETVKRIVAGHFERFAWRDKLTVSWQAGAAATEMAAVKAAD